MKELNIFTVSKYFPKDSRASLFVSSDPDGLFLISDCEIDFDSFDEPSYFCSASDSTVLKFSTLDEVYSFASSAFPSISFPHGFRLTVV